MRTTRRLIVWAWRAWPVHLPLVIFLFQLGLIRYVPVSEEGINDTFALVVQIIGGLLVLYSIDSNIGIVQRESLYSIFIRYVKDFPLLKKSAIVTIGSSSHITTTSKMQVTVKRNPRSLEEKVEYLQEQIDETRSELEGGLKDLNARVDKAARKQEDQIGSLAASVKGVESKVKQVTVGGIKIQICGVILLIYGAVCGYVA